MTSLRLIRQDLNDNQPYIATGEAMAYRLHANELPWPPLDDKTLLLNQYPSQAEEQCLQERLANIYKVANDQVMITRGSDEGIDLLMRLFLQPGIDSILQCPPTFSMYAFFARLSQGDVINCPLNAKEQFRLNIKNINVSWQPNCKLIMLCRPNNPTGSPCDLSLIRTLCELYQGRSMIVVDEAYIEFSNDISAASLINEFDNLIVLRTLSKAYGMAGLRIGSVIAQQKILTKCRAMTPPYRLSSAVISLAMRALTDLGWFRRAITTVITEREKLAVALQQLPWIEKIYPSTANFLFIKTTQTLALFQWCADHGIAVRHFLDSSIISDYLRITVGEEQQNQWVFKVLSTFKTAGAA